MGIATLLVLSLSLSAAQAPAIAGHWEGKIHIAEHELGIAIDVAQSGGAWIGSMSVLQSTAADVPLEDLAVNGVSIRFTAGLPMQATFEGTVSADGHAWSGTATRLDGTAPFDLARMGDAHVSVPPRSTVLPAEFAGGWEGAITVNGKPMGVALKLWAADDGTAHGTLISVGPPSQEIPLTTVTITGKDVRFDSRAVSGTYRGSLNAAGEIVGEWTQRETALPLTLRRAGGPAK